VLIITVPSRALDANCYVVAAGPNSPALVIDPGLGTVEAVDEVVEHHGLSVRAVVASHGHLDHIYDVVAMCDAFDVPLWIHSADRHLLTDPWAGIDSDLRQMLEPAFGQKQWNEPARVQEITGEEMSVGTLMGVGLDVVLRHAPGHTAGSILIDMAGPPAEHSVLLTAPGDELSTFTASKRTIFTGDVLFSGTIGRTDFPVSSPSAMDSTLDMIVSKLPAESAIFPGHGPGTTLAREFRGNQWLASRFS